MVNISINSKNYEVNEDISILDACKQNNIEIPTLCYLKEINEIGNCKMCLVKIKGQEQLVSSCTTKVKDGMIIETNTEEIQEERKKRLSTILSKHNKDCVNCPRNLSCELQNLLIEYKIVPSKFETEKDYKLDQSTSYIIRKEDKCIKCNRCVAVCDKVQKLNVIGKDNKELGCDFSKNLSDTKCIACGQCILSCPAGAIIEKSEIDKVLDALENKDLYVVAATAPAVRVALGEEFDYPIGTNVKGKMVAALKKIGFKKVFDINFGADLTILEESNELIERLTKNENLPMFTSCCPGWVKYVEMYHPDLLPNMSTCKSPQQMLGGIIKTYYARKYDIDSSKLFVVTIMPCVAKKDEKLRDNQSSSGYNDIDAVLTTRELAKLIKMKEIDFKDLQNENFDNPLGTGASVIFGSSGGVMEAALRTTIEVLTNKPIEKINFEEVRGMEGIKEASYVINDKTINVAIVNGIGNAKELLDKIKNKEKYYDFVEVMACPGGCINGGGQPMVSANIKNYVDIKKLRAKAIYEEDKNLPVRKAHNNKNIITLYEEYLKHPASKRAHHILHTTFKDHSK